MRRWDKHLKIAHFAIAHSRYVSNFWQTAEVAYFAYCPIVFAANLRTLSARARQCMTMHSKDRSVIMTRT